MLGSLVVGLVILGMIVLFFEIVLGVRPVVATVTEVEVK